MIKKIYPLFLVLSVAAFFFAACVDDDDNYKIDEEWKQKNQREFFALAETSDYARITGIADPNSYILWRESSFWKNTGEEGPEIPLEGTGVSPIFSDSIACRYEGWYFDKNDRKIIFDSTENPISGSNTDPNKKPRRFLVRELIDGWRVALYRMKEGDEWETVIPYTLGYGTMDFGSIPAFTTLYYQIKLVEVKK